MRGGNNFVIAEPCDDPEVRRRKFFRGGRETFAGRLIYWGGRRMCCPCNMRGRKGVLGGGAKRRTNLMKLMGQVVDIN